jgi:hypothetical protein
MEEKTFAELMTTHMDSMGIGCNKLAHKIEEITKQTISRQTIYKWRNGEVKRPNEWDQVTACADVLGLTHAKRVEFLAAAGCPYNQAIADSTEPQENVIDENLDIIEENSPAIPIINIPINHPRKFFGRERELNRIFGRWQHRPLHNVAIIGQRRSGITSLLHYLKNIHKTTQVREGQRQDWLPTGTQFVFVDFQAAGMCEQEPLLCYLLEELNIPVPEPCNLSHFTKVMRRELQQPTVILMDRIDVGLQSPQLNYQFWWAIRALVTNYTNGNLGLLVASPQLPTEVMPTGGENQPSPFLNIIAEIVKLGPLIENEARELLKHTPQPFAEADVEWILENSGRWPALLQILCDVRLRALNEGEKGEDWKKEGLARIENDRYLSNLKSQTN